MMNIKTIYLIYSTIIHAIHLQLKCGVQYGRNTDTPRNAPNPNKNFATQLKARKELQYIYIYIYKAAIFISFLQITTKHRNLKRLPFKCHCYHSQSTLTVQRTPHIQKRHLQISTADLPANTQSNFIVMFNTQYIKYHI